MPTRMDFCIFCLFNNTAFFCGLQTAACTKPMQKGQNETVTRKRLPKHKSNNRNRIAKPSKQVRIKTSPDEECM